MIYTGDGWEIRLGRWQDSAPESVDVVISDPPYDARTHRKSALGWRDRPTFSFGPVVPAGEGVDLILTISYNPEVGSKTFNVHVPGRGPICRLDVDGPAHRPAGRSHKHALQDTRCPDRNLPDEVVDRPDLSGQGVRELFQEFCNMAKIEHTGVFEAPDEDPA